MDLVHSSILMDIGSGKWTYAVQYSLVGLLNYAFLSVIYCTSKPYFVIMNPEVQHYEWGY